MKVYFLIFAYLILHFKSLGQGMKFNNSFVITINNSLEVNSIVRPRILYTYNNSYFYADMGYVPGDLYFLTESDKKKILSDSTTKLFLLFDYYEYKHNKQNVMNYKISINKNMTSYLFLVLKINNLKKSKNYIYSFQYPGNNSVPIKID